MAVAAIPALVTGAIEMAPTIIAGISALSTAASLFDKYKPSHKTLNTLFSAKGRRSVGTFFKSLATPKGAMRLVSKGVDNLKSGEALSTALSVAKDAASAINALDNLGISNDYTKNYASIINTAIKQPLSINDKLKASKKPVTMKPRPTPISIPEMLPAPPPRKARPTKRPTKKSTRPEPQSNLVANMDLMFSEPPPINRATKPVYKKYY